MFKIAKVEKSNFYIDKAMNSMQEFAIKERKSIEDRFFKNLSTKKKDSDQVKLDKRKDLELEKIRYLNKTLNISMKKVITKFPRLSKIDEIYKSLINTSKTPVKDIENALATLLWITNKIDEFTQNSEHKIKRAKTQQTVGFIMKKYLGKVNSLFRKNKKTFELLDDARKFMNKLPHFEDTYTVAIAGFPNVGKSTLMNKLTNSNVEIQNYPFTTKGLMFGYISQFDKKIIQLIDTPGLLGRDKQNQIEQRAQIIISKFADSIIFVLDFTQTCGYSIKNQIKLLKETVEFQKNISIYISKKDIFDEETNELIDEYKNVLKKCNVFENFEELKKHILDEKTKSKNFNKKDINVIR
ncbi:MAG: GTPase [Nanoarchaeota archaeon]